MHQLRLALWLSPLLFRECLLSCMFFLGSDKTELLTLAASYDS